jgi:hypothetical protein
MGPNRQSLEKKSVAAGNSLSPADLTHLALWMAAALAGLVTTAVAAQAPYFRAAAKKVSGPTRRGRSARRPRQSQALPMLAEAIVGNTKSAIASVFGPPRGAVIFSKNHCVDATFWKADTWYYSLPEHRRTAIAIDFDEDFASRVQFLRPPEIR